MNSQRIQNTFHLKSVSISVHSLQQPLRVIVCSVNDQCFKAFMQNKIMPLTSRGTARTVLTREMPPTINFIFRFFSESNALLKAFQRYARKFSIQERNIQRCTTLKCLDVCKAIFSKGVERLLYLTCIKNFEIGNSRRLSKSFQQYYRTVS